MYVHRCTRRYWVVVGDASKLWVKGSGQWLPRPQSQGLWIQLLECPWVGSGSFCHWIQWSKHWSFLKTSLLRVVSWEGEWGQIVLSLPSGQRSTRKSSPWTHPLDSPSGWPWPGQWGACSLHHELAQRPHHNRRPLPRTQRAADGWHRHLGGRGRPGLREQIMP